VRPLGTVDVLDSLPARSASSQVAEALIEVVNAEGPIHTDRLARLVANGFGLSRVAESRKAAILRHLPRSVRRDRVEPVAWPENRDPDGWSGYRPTTEGADRPIEHISLREIGNAMVTSVEDAAGMLREELHREVLRIFGMKRLTPAVTLRLDAALDLAARSERVRIQDDGYVVPAGR
jgi:hypothetical protein